MLWSARDEIASILGPRPQPKEHAFLAGIDAGGRRAGWMWIGPLTGTFAHLRKRWLYEIAVDEPLRGQGYGRSLLAAAERYLAAPGIEVLGLNVFRWNSVAVALYSSSGYEVFQAEKGNLLMRKTLARG